MTPLAQNPFGIPLHLIKHTGNIIDFANIYDPEHILPMLLTLLTSQLSKG